MDLNSLAVFVAVVEAGSISRAARSLEVGKSSVSRRVAALEASLGVRLFDRTDGAVALTEAGQRFHGHAEAAVEAARQAEAAAQASATEPSGRLRVLSLASFGRLHMMSVIASFQDRYPKVAVDLTLDDRRGAVSDETFDVAVRGGTLARESLVVRKLAELHSVLCASPAYLQAHTAPQDPDALAEHNGLAYSLSEEPDTWHFQREGTTWDVAVRGDARVNNSEALAALVLAGRGIARLPSFIASAHLRAGRLVRLLPSYRMPSKPLWAVLPDRRYVPATSRAFVDHLVDAFAGPVAPWDRAFASEAQTADEAGPQRHP